MSVVRLAAAFAGVLAASLSANAGVITFNMSPPPSGGGNLTNIAGAGGPDSGLLFSDQTVPISFTIDASSIGLGVITYNNARLFMTLVTQPATTTGGGFYQSSVNGSFTIYDYTGNQRVDILSAQVSNSQFINFGQTHVMLFNSNLGMNYTAGPRLANLLCADRYLAPSHDGTIALSNVQTFSGSTNIIRPNNTFDNFTATPAFTGSTNVLSVPTPGFIALAGIGSLVAARRRR